MDTYPLEFVTKIHDETTKQSPRNEHATRGIPRTHYMMYKVYMYVHIFFRAHYTRDIWEN